MRSDLTKCVSHGLQKSTPSTDFTLAWHPCPGLLFSDLIQLREARPRAVLVRTPDDVLTVDLEDSRTIAVPLCWFPRLQHATSEERENWQLIGNGTGIHWPAIDKDIGVESLLRGLPSNESQASLRRWLTGRDN